VPRAEQKFGILSRQKLSKFWRFWGSWLRGF